MECPSPLSVIGTPFSSATSGKSSSRCLVPNFGSVQHTTRRRMARKRSSNHCVEQYLWCFVHQWPKQWCSYLPWAEYWYNTTYHISTGMTPFRALCGHLPPSIPVYNESLTSVHKVDQQLISHDELLRQLKANLAKSMNHMKHVVTHFWTPCDGDVVYLFWTECRSLTHVCWKIDKSRERNIFFSKPGLSCFLLSLPFPFAAKIVRFS